MPTLEERVAYLEGQVSEQSHAQMEIRDAVRSLEHRVDVRFEAVDRRFESLEQRMEARFESLEQRVEARFEAVDRRFDTVDRRIDSLDEKVSRQFVWMVGIQVTTLIAIVGALLARP
jgi:chromosome segregation ATPase